MKRLLVVLFASMMLGGCATLNRSECQNADWNMIGLEDGLKGLPTANIGKHRKACAKYDVTPDLDEYRSGYDEGIRQFCIPERGFELGQSGGQYSGACPPDLEASFLENFNHGRKLRGLINGIEVDKASLRKSKDDLKEKEDQLIHSGSETERAQLLNDIKELQQKIERLKRQIKADSAELIEMGYQ